MIVRTEKLMQDLATGIASRMCARSGDFVYQCSGFNLTNLTPQFLDSVLPHAAIINETRSMKCWQLDQVHQVQTFLGWLLPKHASGYTCAGASRGLKTEKHPWVRVIALVYTMSITWYAGSPDKTSINLCYALCDQHGELHPPKDQDRNEIWLEPQLEGAIREAALADVNLLYMAGTILAPGFLRQLGRDGEAMVAEALEANLQMLAIQGGASTSSSVASIAACPKKQKTIKHASMFNVHSIVEPEKIRGQAGYWVRWEGYHPSWEGWRLPGRGAPGDPLVTWESEWTLRATEALQEYLEQHGSPW